MIFQIQIPIYDHHQYHCYQTVIFGLNSLNEPSLLTFFLLVLKCPFVSSKTATTLHTHKSIAFV